MMNFDFTGDPPIFAKPHFQWGLTTDYVGRRFVYRPTTESTMDDARRIAERVSLPAGTIVLAEQQTAGRGRAGRQWVSPPNVNLYFTLLLFPPPDVLRPLAWVTPLAVALGVEDIARAQETELTADLKWPNDVFIEGRKVAGVLIETESIGERFVALIGVGINVNLDVDDHPEIREIATSVKEHVGLAIAREEMLAAFCNRFEPLWEESLSGSRRPFEEWRKRLITVGRRVVAEPISGRVEGTAVDVDHEGALIIETPAGRRVTVEAGDVLLQA